MGFGELFARLRGRKHRDVRSFDQDVEQVGGVHGRLDRGFKEVPIEKVIGSVGRSHNLRSDFFYKTGEAMTARFKRVGEAMEQGKSLPPLELYKVKGKEDDGTPAESRYYVVDGHHRVAMAKHLGVGTVDAHVVEYRVDGKVGEEAAPAPTEPAKDEPAK
jgi:hypothetical protein